MTPYEVVFAPEAGEQLEELFVYIARRASPSLQAAARKRERVHVRGQW